MKMAICQMTAITVQGFEYGRTMGRGAVVDLDEIVAPGLTLAQALGPHVDQFELVEPPAAAGNVADTTKTDQGAGSRRAPRGPSPSQT